MKKTYFFFSILIIVLLSRIIPHPPNFTPILALSFYLPLLFRAKVIPIFLICFVITDYFLGFHSLTFFTWSSIVLIGLASQFFRKNILTRICGCFVGCCIFFIVTNFGVWLLGFYNHTVEGLILSYIMAIPFFGYTILSTLIYGLIIEAAKHNIKSLKILI